MNPDVLLNRIRLEQRGLIDIHKKLYEMEHLLPIPDPMQFAKTAESAALLSEKSTAHLRNMFFSVSNEPPIYYYPKAAEAQGIACGHLIIICVCCSPRCCRIKRSATAANFFCCHFRQRWCKANHFPTFPTV